MDARSKYDLVYAAAEVHDVGALVMLCQQCVPIDSLDRHGLFTPAATLASNGNHKAVELLKAFGADLSSIAMGYAAGNFTSQTKALVRNHCINLNDLAIGAGMTFVEELRAELIHEFDLAAEWVVFGSVMSEQADKAVQMLQFLKSEYDNKQDPSYAVAFQSAYITYLYAYKLMHGSIKETHLEKEALEFPYLHAHIMWIDRLEQCYMYAGDQELQKIINGLYNKEIHPRIPSNKRIIELQHQNNKFDVAAWLKGSDIHYHENALTYELAFVENIDFVDALRYADKNLGTCCSNAARYRSIMREFQFDYHQAKLYANNELVRSILEQSIINEAEKYYDSLRQLSDLPCVEQDEAGDMLQKYYLAKIKQKVLKLLDDFCNGKDNLLTSLLTNPKLSRLASLKIGIAYVESLQVLHELICFEYSLFSNSFTPEPNPLLPYHLQPLANKNTDDELVQMFSALARSRYFRFALAEQSDCGYMINYKDITAPLPVDPVNEAAVKAARNHFVEVMTRYIAKNQSSVWNMSMFGNKTHKISRVSDMQIAASRAATRGELITIALHQFGLYQRLTRPKPHPQAPKHLTLMTDGETSTEFRQMVEDLLTCNQLKPSNFK